MTEFAVIFVSAIVLEARFVISTNPALPPKIGELFMTKEVVVGFPTFTPTEPLERYRGTNGLMFVSLGKADIL